MVRFVGTMLFVVAIVWGYRSLFTRRDDAGRNVADAA
jgi:hypothetical protein